MLRRAFMTMCLTVPLIPVSASAQDFIDYTPGLIEQELQAGKTVFVDYSAVWCSTCHVQERVINGLRADEASYDASMTFIKVDWDNFGRHAVTTSRDIPRRSTLIVLRGEEELGRIVAGTSRSQIKALMDLGL